MGATSSNNIKLFLLDWQGLMRTYSSHRPCMCQLLPADLRQASALNPQALACACTMHISLPTMFLAWQAPEVIMRKGTTKAADYWALGVLIFEMLVGDPPFKSLSGDPWDTFRRTLSGRFYVPNFISESAADLIYKLLQVGGSFSLPGGGAAAVCLPTALERDLP